MKTLILVSIILLSSSCATTPIVTSVRLECPPPIHLPVLTVEQSLELNQLTKPALKIMIKRENLLKERNETLCGIIETTHDDP